MTLRSAGAIKTAPQMSAWVTTLTIPAATVNQAYTTTLNATGGTPPYTWAGTGVPAGMTLSTAGVLSGTPTAVGTSTITVTATGTGGLASQPQPLQFVVNPVTAVVTVTTTSLPTAFVNSAYSTTLGASGGTPPYTWTVTGQPAWMTASAGGVLSGTPTAAGTSTLAVKATDSTSIASTTVNLTLTTQATSGTWFGAQLPTLPTSFTTTSAPPTAANTNRGSYYTPGVAPDASLTFQAAINAAAAATGTKGDVIVLQAGTTYTTSSSFTLAARAGSGWIYIISSHAPDISGAGLPAAGTRVGRADIPNMASLRTTGSAGGTYLLNRASGAGVSYYRLVGIDFELTDANFATFVINMNAGDTAVSTLCTNITFDRCYVAGAPTNGATRGMGIDGVNMEVTECRIERCYQLNNGDAGAILMLNSTGPYKIHNNYLTGSGETTLTGGGDTLLPSPNMPSDITITNNHYYKAFIGFTGTFTAGSNIMTVTGTPTGELTPTLTIQGSNNIAQTRIVSQQSGTTGGAGTYQLQANATGTSSAGESLLALAWLDKNMIEFKVGQRVLCDSNFFENALGGGQAKAMYVMTSRNQSGSNPWYMLADFTITNNVFTNCYGGGMQWLLQDCFNSATGGQNTQPGYRFLFRNNLCLLSRNSGASDTAPIQILSNQGTGTGAPSPNTGFGGHLIFDHNTWVAPNTPPFMNCFFTMGNSTTQNLQLNNVVWSNNIWDQSIYRISQAGGGSGTYTTAVANQVSQPCLTNNVLTASTPDSTIPAGNFSPGNAAAIGFTSYGSTSAAAGYALTAASPYHAKGVSGSGIAYNAAGTPDSTDLGCNIANLPTS